MARRNDDGSGVVVPVLIILFGLFAAIVIFLTSSIIILGAWIYYFIKLKKLPKPQSLSDFVLTSAERKKIQEVDEKIPFEKGKLHGLNNKLDGLREQGSHLAKRQDGRFQEKSKLGKELNSKIQDQERRVYEQERRIDRLRYTKEEYYRFPMDRLEHYSHILEWYRNLMLSLVVYVSVLVWQLTFPAELTVRFSTFLNENGFLGVILGIENLWGAMAVVTGAAVLAFGLGYLIVPHIISKELNGKTGRNQDEAVAFSEKYAAATEIGVLRDLDPARRQDDDA